MTEAHFQAYFNIAVNIRVMPTKGLTLPLMSYGGSSLLVTCVAIALLLRIEFELCPVARRSNSGGSLFGNLLRRGG